MPLVTSVPQTKWLRQFWMQAQGATQLWTIKSPLTLELEVERSGTQSFGRFSFKVYNLGAQARSDLYRDFCDQSTPREILVNAGYASWQTGYGPQTPQTFPTIARGLITQCFSTRVGPSWVTTIVGWDGGYDQANAPINVTFDKSVTWNQRLNQVARAMTGLRGWVISPQLAAPVSRAATYNGKPWDLLIEMTKNASAQVFIDLGVLYVVPYGTAVPNLTGGFSQINTNMGLLNTPIKQKFVVSFDMIFEPRLLIGQAFTLVSEETENNGSYTVQALRHFGVISDAVAGDLTTMVTSWNQAANRLNTANNAQTGVLI